MAGIPFDSGWAWMVLIGYFINLIIMMGFLKATGVILVELIDTYDTSSSLAGWVVGVIFSTTCITTLLANGMNHKIGSRCSLFVTGILAPLSLIVSSFVNDGVALIFTFGIPLGIAFAFALGPSSILLCNYFKKRLGLANGLAMAGGSIGQMVVPVLFTTLIENYGLRGALLVYGGICFNFLVVGALYRPPSFYFPDFLNQKDIDVAAENHVIENSAELSSPPKIDFPRNRSRSDFDLSKPNKQIDADKLIKSETNLNVKKSAKFQPEYFVQLTSAFPCSVVTTSPMQSVLSIPSHYEPKLSNDILGRVSRKLPRCSFIVIDLTLLKDPCFLLFCCNFVFFSMAFGPAFVFSQAWGREMGMTSDVTMLLVPVIGICDLIGRVSTGFIGDLNLMKRRHLGLIFVTLTAVFCVSAVLLQTRWSLFLLCGFVGLFCGGFITLLLPTQLEIWGLERLPSTFSLVTLTSGVLTFGWSAALGAIEDATGTFFYSVLVANLMYFMSLLSVTFMCILLYFRNKESPGTTEL